MRLSVEHPALVPLGLPGWPALGLTLVPEVGVRIAVPEGLTAFILPPDTLRKIADAYDAALNPGEKP